MSDSRSTASWPAACAALARGIQVVVATGAALALLIGPGAGVATAHDRLVASTPAPGAALPTPPTDVRLEFSNPPQPLGLQIVVTGANGGTVSDGQPRIDGSTVVQPVTADLPSGTYTAEWRVISADGHPITGTTAFTVAADASTDVGPVEPAAAVGPAAPNEASSSTLWLAVGAIGAVAALVIAWQLRRPV